jgi:hypothetical protein
MLPDVLVEMLDNEPRGMSKRLKSYIWLMLVLGEELS